MDDSLKKLISLSLLAKLCIFLVIYLGFNLLPFNAPAHELNFHYPSDEKITLQTAFKTWDGQHYLFLAEQGYGLNPLSDGFFPLFPLLIRLAAPLFLGSFFAAGLFLANLFSLTAIIFFYLLVKELFDEKTALIAGLFLLAFPTAFYQSLIYSEALFLMLAVMCFYFVARQNLVAAAIVTFFLPLARAQGILILIPLLAMVWKGRTKFITYTLPAAIVLGFLAYLITMKYFAGSFFRGFAAQEYVVSQYSIFNLFNPIDWFNRNFVYLNWALHDFTHSVLDRSFFAGFSILLYFIYRKSSLELFLYALLLGLVPALSDSFMSYTRYLSIIFPLYLVLALWLKEKHYYLTIPMLVLQVIFLLMHSLNFWVA